MESSQDLCDQSLLLLPEDLLTQLLLLVTNNDILQLRLVCKELRAVASKCIVDLFTYNGVLPDTILRAFPNATAIRVKEGTSSQQLLALCASIAETIECLDISLRNEFDPELGTDDAALEVLLQKTASRKSFRISNWQRPVTSAAANKLLQSHPMRFVHIKAPILTSEPIPLPSHLHSLEDLCLSGPLNSSNEQAFDLAPLTTATNLRNLHLGGATLAAAVGSCTSLHSIHVTYPPRKLLGTQAQFFNLQALAALKQLRSLRLVGVNCPGNSWQGLASMPLLEELEVNAIFMPRPAAGVAPPALSSLKTFATGHWVQLGSFPGFLSQLLPSLQECSIGIAKPAQSINNVVLGFKGHAHLRSLGIRTSTQQAASGPWQASAQHLPALERLALPMVEDMGQMLLDVGACAVERLVLVPKPGASMLDSMPYNPDLAANLVRVLTTGNIVQHLQVLGVRGLCKLSMQQVVQLAVMLPQCHTLSAAMVLPRAGDAEQLQQLMAKIRQELLQRGWFFHGGDPSSWGSLDVKQPPSEEAEVAMKLEGWQGYVPGMTVLELGLDVYVDRAEADVDVEGLGVEVDRVEVEELGVKVNKLVAVDVGSGAGWTRAVCWFLGGVFEMLCFLLAVVFRSRSAR